MGKVSFLPSLMFLTTYRCCGPVDGSHIPFRPEKIEDENDFIGYKVG